MTAFALATIATPTGDRAALVVDGRYYRLEALAPELPAVGLRPLMDSWDALFARCQALADQIAAGGAPAGAEAVDPRVLAPLRFPNKLVCVGAVYRDHLEQFGLPGVRWANMPIFLRPPTTSIGSPGVLRIPPTTKQFDWEVEMAVVIGKRLTNGDEAAAEAAIAGYSIGIDFSCRDLVDRDSPVGADLVRAKAQDGMGPMGPVMTPKAFMGDPQNLRLKLWVNDELKQDGTTADMLFPVYEQVATISRYITLEPGDVVFTGSPAGSAHGGAYLKAGDRVRAEIEKIGALELTLSDTTTLEEALAI